MKFIEFIDLKKQYACYKKEIDAAIQSVLDAGNYIMGSQVIELESTLANFVEKKHCITVSSGTDSLQVSLMALGIGFGDEVITVPFTWISTAEVIKLVGAKPVFVDIDPDTYLIDVNQIRSLITNKTKAIIAVDLFGQIADYNALNQLSLEFNIPIIQDAAQSFGATQNGKNSCSQAVISSTSFFPAKTFGCYGDGGAIFTDDDQLAFTMKAIRTHGGIKRHHHTHLGYNSRLDTIQAAILLAKFPHFHKEIEMRKAIGARYTELLKNYCKTPIIMDQNTHVYAQYTIEVENRDALAEMLKGAGIPTGVYYPKCLHEQPVFSDLGYQWGDFPNAEKASREVLSLPMHPWLTESEQDFIIEKVIEFSPCMHSCLV